MLLTIDPGNDTGWALWLGDGQLGLCGLGDPIKSTRSADVQEAVMESPVVYPRSKVPPNDVVTLARQAGRYAGLLEARGTKVRFVSPAAWKGQVPKKIHHPRILRSLSEVEREIVLDVLDLLPASTRHNVLDAVGIGLWALKRK